MIEVTIRIHEVAKDGLPNMDELTNRVAFICDGCIVSGWPLFWKEGHETETEWEADSGVCHGYSFGDVAYWVEFPVPLADISECQKATSGSL